MHLNHLHRASGKRVAFFGGSFDPPHHGHLAVARAARAALNLDTVLFAPVGAQPLKPQGSTASFADRLEMTRLAIADEVGFALSLADAPKADGTPNYSLETLQELHSQLPTCSTLFCLMGADSFVGLQRWHRAAEIPFIASLVVASRPGERLDRLQAALPQGLTIEAQAATIEMHSGIEIHSYELRNASGARTPFFLLPGLEVEISASEIRADLPSFNEVCPSKSSLLPDSVCSYIQKHGLYRGA